MILPLTSPAINLFVYLSKIPLNNELSWLNLDNGKIDSD